VSPEQMLRALSDDGDGSPYREDLEGYLDWKVVEGPVLSVAFTADDGSITTYQWDLVPRNG
jgi:hypothetical protein